MSGRHRCPVSALVLLGLLLVGRSALAAVTEVEGTAAFSQRFLYRVPVELGTLTIAPGVRYTALTVSFPITFDGGSTLEGLSVYGARMGVALEHVLGRVRIGYGVSTGGLFVGRATGGRFFAGVWDFMVRATFDIARFGTPRVIAPDGDAVAKSAVFVSLAMHGDTVTMVGPSVGLGVRY